jgi:mRNA interferase MazF
MAREKEGVRQFEIGWADLPEPVGRRPVLLLSRNDAYQYLSKFIAVEITSTVRGIASEVALSDDEGLPKACVANCDSLRMIPRTALTRLAGRLAPERWVEVKRAMGAALGWRELTDLD